MVLQQYEPTSAATLPEGGGNYVAFSLCLAHTLTHNAVSCVAPQTSTKSDALL